VREGQKDAELSPSWQDFLQGKRQDEVKRQCSRYIAKLLEEAFQGELHDLATGAHRVLYPEQDEARGTPEEGRGQSWRQQKAAQLFRLAWQERTDRDGPLDMEKAASRAEQR